MDAIRSRKVIAMIQLIEDINANDRFFSNN